MFAEKKFVDRVVLIQTEKRKLENARNELRGIIQGLVEKNEIKLIIPEGKGEPNDIKALLEEKGDDIAFFDRDKAEMGFGYVDAIGTNEKGVYVRGFAIDPNTGAYTGDRFDVSLDDVVEPEDLLDFIRENCSQE